MTRGTRPFAVVENVVTHEAHRRRGLASALFDEVRRRCEARGCYKIMLMSGAHRTQVHRFYESVGFDKNAKQAFLIRC